MSYEGIISAARAVMGTETTVSGDVILNGNEFILIARTADAGPWESVSSPISADGLKRANRDLAEKILATQDPTLAGAALLKDGQVDQALTVFNRALILKPTDARIELNLCMGFEANRRYQDAIQCYRHVRNMDPSSGQEVSERLAQAHYLNGDRDDAIKQFEDLAYKQGYTAAWLDLGKALEDTGEHEKALNAYDKFLASNPKSRNLAIAHVNRGRLFHAAWQARRRLSGISKGAPVRSRRRPYSRQHRRRNGQGWGFGGGYLPTSTCSE